MLFRSDDDDDDDGTTGYGGGGGSGGVSFYTTTSPSGTSTGIQYSVGSGGPAQNIGNCDDSPANGSAGNPSTFGTATAGGGGGGQGVGDSGSGSGVLCMQGGPRY